MKFELCKFCGTRDHRPGEMHLCSAMKSDGPTDKAKAREPKRSVGASGDEPRAVEASRGGKRVVESRQTLTKTPDGLSTTDSITMTTEEVREKVKRGEISDTVAGIALTATERHKRYREKHGDEYREKNRLRMAEKRKRDAG